MKIKWFNFIQFTISLFLVAWVLALVKINPLWFTIPYALIYPHIFPIFEQENK